MIGERPTSVDAYATGLFAAATAAVYMVGHSTLAMLSVPNAALAAAVGSLVLATLALVVGLDDRLKRELAERFGLEADGDGDRGEGVQL